MAAAGVRFGLEGPKSKGKLQPVNKHTLNPAEVQPVQLDITVVNEPLEPPNPYSMGGSKYTDPQNLPQTLPLVVHAGVDTLYENYKITPHMFLAQQPFLIAWKLEAQDVKERKRAIPIGALVYYLGASGRHNWPYVLVVPGYGEVLINYREDRPMVRVRLYSGWLAGCKTFDDMAAGARDLVEGFFGVGSAETQQISQLDLAVDVAGFLLNLGDLQAGRLTCPATIHLENVNPISGEVHSLWWGKHGSPISAVLYNKSKEIREQSEQKAYMLDGWRAAGWSEADGDVTRIEFRFAREWLRECGITGPGDVDLSAMLQAGMQWLVLRDVKPTDKNSARWDTSADWTAIHTQAGKLLGSSWRAYERVYVPNASVDRLAAQIGGCVASIGALGGSDDLDGLFVAAQAIYQQRLDRQGREFRLEVATRCDRYMVPGVAHPADAVAAQD